jgi:hypothetical protein
LLAQEKRDEGRKSKIEEQQKKKELQEQQLNSISDMARGFSLLLTTIGYLIRTFSSRYKIKRMTNRKRKSGLKIVRTNNNKRKGRNSRNCTKSISTISG